MEDGICLLFSTFLFMNSVFLKPQTNEMLVNDRWLCKIRTEKIGTTEESLVTNSPPQRHPFPILHEVNIWITSPTTIYGHSS